MKVLVAVGVGADVSSIETSFRQAGHNPIVARRGIAAHLRDPNLDALVTIGMDISPSPAALNADLPWAALVSMADLEAARCSVESREALRRLGQRVDEWFVDSHAAMHRLAGVLGILGRLNRHTFGVRQVHVYGSEELPHVLGRWLDCAHRAPDATQPWPKLGGAAVAVEPTRRWFRPRRWLRALISR